MSVGIQETLFVGAGLVLIIAGFKRNWQETLLTLGAMSVGIGLLLCSFTPR